MMVMRSLIWRRTSQVSRKLNLFRGFTSSMTQRKTFQLINLLSLTREIRRSKHWQVLFVSLTRLTKNSPLHIKKLLRCHFRLLHIGFRHVQWLIRIGRLKVQGNSKAVANCETPKFSFCDFGKGHRRPNKVNTIYNNPMKEQDLKKDHLLPGKMVSVEHNISRAPGRLYHTKGDLWEGFSESGSGDQVIPHL